MLQHCYPPSSLDENSQVEGEENTEGRISLGRVFIIGGAEVYMQALRMESCERMLWTRLKGEWECDAYFPRGVLKSVSEYASEGKTGEERETWVVRGQEEMERWVGEEGIGGLKKEGETEWDVVMVEREGER